MWHSAVKDIPSMVEHERLHRTPYSSAAQRSIPPPTRRGRWWRCKRTPTGAGLENNSKSTENLSWLRLIIWRSDSRRLCKQLVHCLWQLTNTKRGLATTRSSWMRTCWLCMSQADKFLTNCGGNQIAQMRKQNEHQWRITSKPIFIAPAVLLSSHSVHEARELYISRSLPCSYTNPREGESRGVSHAYSLI